MLMLTYDDVRRVGLTIEVMETPHTQKRDVGRHTRPQLAARPSNRDSRKRLLQRGGANRWRSMVSIGPWSTKQMRESPGRRHMRRTHRNSNRNQLLSSFFQPPKVCVGELMGWQKWDGERMRVSPLLQVRLLTPGTQPLDGRRRKLTSHPYPRSHLQQSSCRGTQTAEADPEMWSGRNVAELWGERLRRRQKGPPARRRWPVLRFLRARRSPPPGKPKFSIDKL